MWDDKGMKMFKTSVNLRSILQSTLSWKSKCIDITLIGQSFLGFFHICC